MSLMESNNGAGGRGAERAVGERSGAAAGRGAPAGAPSASCTELGNSSMRSRPAATDADDTVLMAVGPPVLVDFDSHSPRSQQDRTRREDRRLKFYELRDKLLELPRGPNAASIVAAGAKLRQRWNMA
jgi:hypothetical protein